MVETATPTPTKDSPRRRPWRAVLIGVVLVGAVLAGGLLWFFGGDAPDEVNLAETASAVTDGSLSDAAATGIEGMWTVDTTVGEFSVTEDTTATFAGFRVEEVLESIGSTTAVGRTPAVAGSIEIEGDTLTSAELTVDLTAIESDQDRREDNIQRALGTSSNPEAVFVLTEPIALGDAAAAGEAVAVTATGELTVNGVTQAVEIPLEAQLVDGKILVTGSVEIAFTDYGVTVPSAPVVLSVEDHGTLELQLWLSR
jgi:polyisoprenoid-binding protein YceI